ncbi:hypothetical protein BGAL_0708g00010 [Botrytis galanthina]|uniref:Uncharacterized protein n=1 Tax=Botrytis galanthina TaxID=278940 RepID=A0A4S8QI61_9HELO|nr:hypothetical protein BGAL_0708g00010 [Botrytis galanthina]
MFDIFDISKLADQDDADICMNLFIHLLAPLPNSIHLSEDRVGRRDEITLFDRVDPDNLVNIVCPGPSYSYSLSQGLTPDHRRRIPMASVVIFDVKPTERTPHPIHPFLSKPGCVQNLSPGSKAYLLRYILDKI